MKRQTAADPHERILAAAAAVFANRGFEGARIDEIAAQAGVNKAMLYYHVGDKSRLFAAVLRDSMERALSLLRASTASAEPPGAKLQAVLDTFAAFGTSNPGFIPILLREVASGGRNLPDEIFARMGDVPHVVADVLAEGVERGVFRPTDPLLTHVTLIGALMYLLATHPIRQRVARASGTPVADHTPAHLARHVGNLVLQGLEAPPPAVPRAPGARTGGEARPAAAGRRSRPARRAPASARPAPRGSAARRAP
jgi:TetR/AcrR family transcriptional regulator